jgi:serine protease inhibitor
MLHGVVMSFSWYQMAGRLMVTNPLHFNGCWSYPAYKSESVTNKVFAVDSVSSPAFPMD